MHVYEGQRSASSTSHSCPLFVYGHTVSPLHWSERDHSHTKRQTQQNSFTNERGCSWKIDQIISYFSDSRDGWISFHHLYILKVRREHTSVQHLRGLRLFFRVKGEKCFRRERIPPQSPYRSHRHYGNISPRLSSRLQPSPVARTPASHLLLRRCDTDAFEISGIRR